MKKTKLSENQIALLREAPIRHVLIGARRLTMYSLVRRGFLARKRGKRWNDPTVLVITAAGRAAIRGGV